MKKLIVFLTVLVFFFVPFSFGFAYSGGLLQGKIPNSYSGFTDTNHVTDGDQLTKATLRSLDYGSIEYILSTDSTIDKIYSIFSGEGGLYVEFFNSSNVKIFNMTHYGGLINISDVENVKRIKISNGYGTGFSLNEFDVIPLDSNPIIHDEISNLVLIPSHNEVFMSWSIPSGNSNFTGAKIYKGGQLLTTVDKNTSSFIDKDVLGNTSYTYKVTALYDDGYETAGVSKELTTSAPPPDRDGDGIPDSEDAYPDDPTNTPPPVEAGEVENLEITTTYKSANLSWVLPKTENLQHVNIYRETLTQETSFMDNLINGKRAYAASEKIFETNGTYFNDYTVKPETEYKYTITTTSVDGVESEGVTATTTTPVKPAITFEELSLPFSVKDLISSGNGLLWIVGPFILLALAFMLIPKLRNLIFGAFRKYSKGTSEASERRTKVETIQKMESQDTKEFRTDREPKSERVEVAPKPIREPKELKQPRIRETKERKRIPKLSRERIREPRATRASREPRERTRKPRDRREWS
ncbi:hypothetical protein [Cytobacillus firmus]|uniref:hypothetical protein n=1 Tax=Cytobacillus firmus TaxID=1399 RepID=UPI0018CCE801|nr:hypothetical protein [Cytobacillus firmus]